MTNITFILTRPARKQGGDRYEANLIGQKEPMVIYIPQHISRHIDSHHGRSDPVDALEITIKVPRRHE